MRVHNGIHRFASALVLATLSMASGCADESTRPAQPNPDPGSGLLLPTEYGTYELIRADDTSLRIEKLGAKSPVSLEILGDIDGELGVHLGVELTLDGHTIRTRANLAGQRMLAAAEFDGVEVQLRRGYDDVLQVLETQSGIEAVLRDIDWDLVVGEFDGFLAAAGVMDLRMAGIEGLDTASCRECLEQAGMTLVSGARCTLLAVVAAVTCADLMTLPICPVAIAEAALACNHTHGELETFIRNCRGACRRQAERLWIKIADWWESW